MASGPTTSWEIDGETVETASDFILGGSQITADPWVGKTLWRNERLPTPVFWPGNPWGCKELDRTEWLSLSNKFHSEFCVIIFWLNKCSSKQCKKWLCFIFLTPHLRTVPSATSLRDFPSRFDIANEVYTWQLLESFSEEFGWSGESLWPEGDKIKEIFWGRRNVPGYETISKEKMSKIFTVPSFASKKSHFFRGKKERKKKKMPVLFLWVLSPSPLLPPGLNPCWWK